MGLTSQRTRPLPAAQLTVLRGLVASRVSIWRILRPGGLNRLSKNDWIRQRNSDPERRLRS